MTIDTADGVNTNRQPGMPGPLYPCRACDGTPWPRRSVSDGTFRVYCLDCGLSTPFLPMDEARALWNGGE